MLRFRRPPGGGRRASSLNASDARRRIAPDGRFPCSESASRRLFLAASGWAAVGGHAVLNVRHVPAHTLALPAASSSFLHPANRFRLRPAIAGLRRDTGGPVGRRLPATPAAPNRLRIRARAKRRSKTLQRPTAPPLFPPLTFRPTAFTIRPRQAVIAQTATRTARVSGLSPSSNVWKSCFPCLPTLGRLLRISSEPWTAFDKDRPSIGRLLKFNSLTPQDCTPTTCSLAPDAPANRQATFRESGSLPVCSSALQERRRPPPLSECRFFAPSVRVCLSSMPFNPDATHSHQPRYPSLAPVRGHCGLSAAALEDSGVIRAVRNRRCGCTGAAPGGARSGKRGWCSPLTRRRRRRRRRVRVRVAQHSGQSAASLPSPQKRHSESVAPAAFKSALLCVAIPQSRAVAAEYATPTPS